jgi:hypothetical protein
VLLYSPSSFWLFLRKKGFLKKCWWGHLNSLDFFWRGNIWRDFLFYFNVGSFRCLDFFYDALFKRAAIFTTP